MRKSVINVAWETSCSAGICINIYQVQLKLSGKIKFFTLLGLRRSTLILSRVIEKGFKSVSADGYVMDYQEKKEYSKSFKRISK